MRLQNVESCSHNSKCDFIGHIFPKVPVTWLHFYKNCSHFLKNCSDFLKFTIIFVNFTVTFRILQSYFEGCSHVIADYEVLQSHFESCSHVTVTFDILQTYFDLWLQLSTFDSNYGFWNWWPDIQKAQGEIRKMTYSFEPDLSQH